MTKPRQRFTDEFKREAVALLQPRDRPLHLRQELTIAALNGRPALELIHHSGRGSQCAASDYRELLKANGIVPSMSRKGNCWDNAPMESWFHILKTELVHHTGGREVIIAPDGSDVVVRAKPRPDDAPVRAKPRSDHTLIAHWHGRIGGSACSRRRTYRSAAELAEAEKVTKSFVNRLLRLTLLAPDIVEAILEERQPKGMQLQDITRAMPSVWEAQRAQMGQL